MNLYRRHMVATLCCIGILLLLPQSILAREWAFFWIKPGDKGGEFVDSNGSAIRLPENPSEKDVQLGRCAGYKSIQIRTHSGDKAEIAREHLLLALSKADKVGDVKAVAKAYEFEITQAMQLRTRAGEVIAPAILACRDSDVPFLLK